MQHDAQNPMNNASPIPAGRTYTNAVLTAVAVMLGVIALNMSGAGLPRSADAQVGVVGARPVDVPADGLVSAAEQRKMIHAELRTLNEKVDRLQAAIDKGISVRVTAMPAADKPATDKADAAPAKQ